jgi:hypothetical protein
MSVQYVLSMTTDEHARDAAWPDPMVAGRVNPTPMQKGDSSRD